MATPLQPVDYPNPLHDVAIQGARGPWTRMLVLRPRSEGRFSLFVHPHGFRSRPFLQRWDLLFEDRDGPPARLEFSPPKKYQTFRRWHWLVVPWPESVNPRTASAGKNRPPLILAVPEDPQQVVDSDLLFGPRPVLEGELDFGREAEPERDRRLVVWSCHQPYGTAGEKAVVEPHVEHVMTWYRRQMDQFNPHEIWGLGDTMYSDGADAVNVVKQLTDAGDWWTSRSNLERMRRAFADAYRYHWSFLDFQRCSRSYPHVAIWDDHEIRDGWGSEETDFTPSGLAMLRQARLAADDYILDLGPRMHPRSPPNAPIGENPPEAHCAYIDGEIAAFIFDGRSCRRYRDCTGRLISDVQMAEFAAFCGQVAADQRVRTLFLGIGTALVNLADVFEDIGSVLPDWINEMDSVGRVRDDVRDGWNAPGNRAQLRQLCGIWLWLHRTRPDLEFVVISGDIHLSNAFTFQPPGFAKPIYQITTSALTNRQSAPELLTKIGGQDTDWSVLVDQLGYVIPAPCISHFSIEGMLKGAVVASLLGVAASAAPAIYGAWRLLNLDFSSAMEGFLGSMAGGLLAPLFPPFGLLIGGFSIGSQRNDNPVQSVKRLWQEERNPNVLLIENTSAGVTCTLKVYDLRASESGETRSLVSSLDRAIRIGIDKA